MRRKVGGGFLLWCERSWLNSPKNLSINNVFEKTKNTNFRDCNYLFKNLVYKKISFLSVICYGKKFIELRKPGKSRFSSLCKLCNKNRQKARLLWKLGCNRSKLQLQECDIYNNKSTQSSKALAARTEQVASVWCTFSTKESFWVSGCRTSESNTRTSPCGQNCSRRLEKNKIEFISDHEAQFPMSRDW